MKTHTSGFKDSIKEFGREIDAKIIYTLDDDTIELGAEELNSVVPHYEGALLKSVMKQLDLDSNVDIPLNTVLNAQFGVKVNGEYEYINFGNYVVYKSEKQEDTDSYKITCYDKMLYSMIDYETPKVNGTAITYPITVRNYINAICSHLGLTFKNASNSFTNYNKEISNELYLDSNGNSLGYTFRDVLDELAEVTASTICINETDDKLEIRYISTSDYNIFNNFALSTNPYNVGDYLSFSKYQNTYLVINGVLPESPETQEVSPLNNISNITLKANKVYTLKVDILSGTYTRFNPDLPSKFILKCTSNSDAYYFEIPMFPNSYSSTYRNYFMPVEDVQLEKLYFKLSSKDIFNYLTIKISVVEKRLYLKDTINEEFLKDVNVNFGEKFGAVNTVILSRSNGVDKIAQSRPSDLQDEDKVAIEIKDNQIMNFNDRDTYLTNILDRLYNLEYYVNDFSSPGITYFDLCDGYGVQIGETVYPCLMLNDEINITQGLEENVYTELPKETVTDYTKVSESDRKQTQAYIIANKAEGKIEQVVSAVGTDGEVNAASIKLAINNDSSEIKINADEVNIEANDILNILANNTINLTSKTITIDSTNFSVDAHGNIKAESGKIGGYNITKNSLYAENYAKHDYTSSDRDLLQSYLQGQTSLTDEQKEYLDINSDGVLDVRDLVLIQKCLTYNITTQNPTTIAMNSGINGIDSSYEIIDGNNTSRLKISISGINTESIATKDISAGNIDCGNCTLTSSGWATVYFNKTFADIPKVVVTPHTTIQGAIPPKIRDVTTTYFTATIGGSISGNIDCDWIAIS